MVSSSATGCAAGPRIGLPVAIRRTVTVAAGNSPVAPSEKVSRMTKPAIQVLRACTLTIALLGSVAIVSAVSMPDMAFAKSGNDNGNGGGNGGGNGNGNGGGNGNGNGGNGNGNGNGGNGNGGGKAVEKSSSKANSDTAPTKKTKAKKKDALDGLGLSASDLGALNAAHANPNALKNASPNSRVGRIAAYRDAVLEGRELEADLDEKAALLETMTPPDRPVADIESELVDARDDVALKAGDVTRLETELADAGGSDPAIEADLAAARDALAEAEATEGDLAAELADAEAYADLEAEIADLEGQLEDQPELERSLLEAAANKPVTDAVEAAVKKLLGL